MSEKLYNIINSIVIKKSSGLALSIYRRLSNFYVHSGAGGGLK